MKYELQIVFCYILQLRSPLIKHIDCFIFLLILNTITLQAVFEKRLKDQSIAVPLLCCAADMLTVPSRKQVVLVGDKASPEFADMVAAVFASYDPNRTVNSSSPFFCQYCLFVILSWRWLLKGDMFTGIFFPKGFNGRTVGKLSNGY